MTRVVLQQVPDLGEFRDVEVIEVLVKAGDTIDVDSPLITLETDKATMDVPATAAGIVQELKVAKGDPRTPTNQGVFEENSTAGVLAQVRLAGHMQTQRRG